MANRILVIDDELNIRTMIRLALEFSGYEVDTAGDGAEGLTKFGDGSSWDLVLLDQRMPGMSGNEVQAKMREVSPNSRLIVITAFGTIDMALEAIKNGAVDFLRKPFTIETLRLAVRSALNKPVMHTAAVPANTVLGAFTRTTINGFSFSMVERVVDQRTGERKALFDVALPDGAQEEVTVKVPNFVIELVKAYADCDRLPAEDRFWTAMAEEALANYLWQNAELPPSNNLVIDDLSAGLQRWLDEIFTVDSAKCTIDA